jgi:hypothetical protein
MQPVGCICPDSRIQCMPICEDQAYTKEQTLVMISEGIELFPGSVKFLSQVNSTIFCFHTVVDFVRVYIVCFIVFALPKGLYVNISLYTGHWPRE